MKKIAFILCGILAITSCEKSEFENESVQVQEASREEINSDHTTALKKPIFHASYDKNLTEKEANAKFEKDAKNFINKYKQKNSNRSSSTNWLIRVATRTGQIQNAETDDDVTFTATFEVFSNSGKFIIFKSPDFILDNPIDDREQGQWDYYIFSINYSPNFSSSSKPLSHIILETTQIKLSGNDGWYVTYFNVDAPSYIQPKPTSGSTRIYTQPNVWLDNDDPNAKNFFQEFRNNNPSALYFE
ncbi:hypothetical protein ABW636_10340 [Aquimarina sp. 2201CG1-2-11]|uniref:hypothetical protein n=1 Tax=Aquimarina discodermiae TaxID=3231043 RepID=UPI00346216A9